MINSDEFAERLEEFPPGLRTLVQAELAAGNSIVEIGAGFPAPPVGAYLKLAKPVSTRPRKSELGVDFHERHSSIYSGEFTDAKRFFFVLEPPFPEPPAPDMNAIRAALEAKQRAADVELFREQAEGNYRSNDTSRAAMPSSLPPGSPPAATSAPSAVQRFRESMIMNFERWHDGIGYDLEILKTATPEELVTIEEILLSHGTDDWRDVEALAALDSPHARAALTKAHKGSNHQVRLAVQSYAPALVTDEERTTALIAALEGSEIYSGLTQALLEIETFHPPAIIEALLRGVLTRRGGNAVHFAAMLMFVQGRADSAFDWKHRPFFLRFHTTDRIELEALFRELCEKIEVAAEKYLE